MSVRYIGSKVRVADEIVDLAGPPGQGRFVDGFCGTGSVAAVASSRGWNVLINDSMPSAVTMATGALVGRNDVQFKALNGYENTCQALNDQDGNPGFIHREYSPASISNSGIERRYFTESNAVRIDSMRAKIAAWSEAGYLSINEERLLLADLMQAANRVANISGTYGCFLSKWTSNSLRAIELRPRVLLPENNQFETKIGDVFQIETTSNDVVYFDPPYTKRQYAAYYHLLETIVAGDEPSVSGVTGLRPWRDKASEFSYKTRALTALTRLVCDTKARKILLSYSNEGHVKSEELLTALSASGKVTFHPIKTIGRYRPNTKASEKGETVNEFVIEIDPFLFQQSETQA